jgi:hypothetical protein
LQSFSLEELSSYIESRKSSVEELMLQKGRTRTYRRRERDAEEKKILHQICALRWKKAEEEGKIKYLSQTQWYYDPS